MSRAKKNGEAPTSPTTKNINSTTIVAQKEAQILTPKEIDGSSTITPKNRFTSFEEFKSFVKDSFINGSAIAPELFAECVEFHEDVEWTDGMDLETPIHDELGWYFVRFPRQVREPIYAAFLSNEDGSLWQAVISEWVEEKQRPYRYIAPKGCGDRAFLPPVPKTIRKKIASRYGLDVPMEGSFWEWVSTAKIPRIVTEGGKKGLAALSQGYVTISLFGCRCGGGKSKDDDGMELEPRLTQDLERLAADNSIWLLAMDRDDSHKAKISVTKGKKHLGDALKIACNPFLEDIVWRPEQGKGIDDLIVSSGSGAFDRAYSDAVSRLEKSFKLGTPKNDEPEKHKNPSPDQMAKQSAKNGLPSCVTEIFPL
jgi:putative DNA primase/helicase